MAKRGAHGRFVKGGSHSIVRYRSAPKPIVVRVPTSPKKHTKGRRRHHSGAMGGGSLQKGMMASAIGGYAVGFIEKQFPTLPTIPVIGKKGTIAAIAYMLAGKGGSIGKYARDVAMVAAGLAGYEYGSTGKVTGVAGEVTRQVSGAVAAQV